MTAEANTLKEVLNKLEGKVLTIINPESYKATPLGFRLDTQFYKGKIKTVKEDHLVLLCEFVKDARKGDKEVVTQYLPLDRIKRVSMLPDEICLHI